MDTGCGRGEHEATDLGFRNRRIARWNIASQILGFPHHTSHITMPILFCVAL